jgi:outer membrane protease
MIDLSNAQLEFTEESSRFTDSVTVRATLGVFAEAAIEKVFLANPETRKQFENNLRAKLQDVIYGDFINGLINAYRVSLERAQYNMDSYEYVKKSFQPVFNELIKITIPGSYPKLEQVLTESTQDVSQ